MNKNENLKKLKKMTCFWPAFSHSTCALTEWIPHIFFRHPLSLPLSHGPWTSTLLLVFPLHRCFLLRGEKSLFQLHFSLKLPTFLPFIAKVLEKVTSTAWPPGHSLNSYSLASASTVLSRVLWQKLPALWSCPSLSPPAAVWVQAAVLTWVIATA